MMMMIMMMTITELDVMWYSMLSRPKHLKSADLSTQFTHVSLFSFSVITRYSQEKVLNEGTHLDLWSSVRPYSLFSRACSHLWKLASWSTSPYLATWTWSRKMWLLSNRQQQRQVFPSTEQNVKSSWRTFRRSPCQTHSKTIGVEREEMMLRGSPVSEDKAQDAVIMYKTEELQKAAKRLALLHSYDALVLWRTVWQFRSCFIYSIVGRLWRDAQDRPLF